MALSVEEIKNNLVNQILQNFPTVEVETGSVLRDIFIDPQSVQIAALSEEIDYVHYLNTFVQNADKISEEDLDEIGATYNVARKDGNLSQGLITFQATTLPTETITIGNEDGSGGISVKTLITENGNSYVFTTTETVYLTPDATYNEEHKCYEVTAHISASTAGSEYNLGVGTIKVLDNGIANITGVYNYVPTTGGTDRQTNLEYALSIQNSVLGSSKNIESGINSILESIENVQEVKTLHPNSSEEPTKAGYAISYVKGSYERIKTDEITYINTTKDYDLLQRPVTRIISVIATVNGEQKTLTQGIDYILLSDESSIYKGTIYAADKIELLGTTTGTPDTGTKMIITYAYNYLIENCQKTLNEQLNNYLILGNIYVSQATPIILDIATNIKLKYNYNTEVVKNEILTAISNYITSLPLGGDITQAELNSYLLTNYSEYITSINFPFSIFCKDGENKSSSEIILNYGQYASVDENSLNITFE